MDEPYAKTKKPGVIGFRRKAAPDPSHIVPEGEPIPPEPGHLEAWLRELRMERPGPFERVAGRGEPPAVFQRGVREPAQDILAD